MVTILGRITHLWNQSIKRDNMIGFQLDGIKKSEQLKLVRFLPNFCRDDFLARVRGSIHSENMIRPLESSVSIANNK